MSFSTTCLLLVLLVLSTFVVDGGARPAGHIRPSAYRGRSRVLGGAASPVFMKSQSSSISSSSQTPTVAYEWQTQEVMVAPHSAKSSSQATVYELAGSRSVVVDSDNRIHVVYCEELDAKFFRGRLLYTHSDDDGLSWSEPREVTPSTGPSSPQITMSPDNTLFVAYLDRKNQAVRLLVTKSEDYGSSWSAPTAVTVEHSSFDAFFPSIQIDDLARVHLTWHEADRADVSPRRSNVFYARSLDGGIEFSSPTRLNTIRSASAFSRFTLGGSTGSLLATAWSDFRNGEWDLMIARSMDGGETWEERNVLSHHAGADFNPDLLVTVNGELHLVWHNSIVQQNLPVSHVMYMRSEDFGNSWTDPLALSADQGRFPQWAVKEDSSALTVSWLDEKNFGNNRVCPLPERCSDVVMTFSVDGGDTWEEPEQTQYEGVQSTLSHSTAFLSDGRPVMVWNMPSSDSSKLQRLFSKVRKTPLPI